MKSPKIPKNEKDRLSELRSYDILDTVLERSFDDITKIAAYICESPISLVSLIDKDRQWFKSRHGLDVSETPRDLAYCAHAILTPQSILEIPDAFEDERFHDNPLATGDPHVRFYAGAPLVSSNGFSLGTLCVIDHKPKKLSEAQREALWALSCQVTALLELRKTNRNLVESRKEKAHVEKTFQERIERIGDMVYELNTEGYFIYVNPALVRESGCSEEYLLKMHFSDLVDPDDRERVSQHYIEILKNQTRSSYLEFKMKGTNSSIWVGQTVEIEFMEGVGVRTFGVARNISERRKYEEAIQEAMELAELSKQEAIESAKAKENFLSTMSHEIRTPLNAILGVTNLLLMENLKEEHLEHLNLLKFSGENLLSLINDILDYNKIESGKVELERTEFNLKQVLMNLKKSLTPAIDKKGLEIVFTYDDNLPEIFIGDSVRITQVINNLLSNAIKFTEEGFVKLAVALVEEKAKAARIHFEAHDSGIGIEKANQTIIFENFEQASDDITRKFGGTGLGLAISKKLLQLMDSQIELDSELGFGSIFSFDLVLPVGKKTGGESETKTLMPEFENLSKLNIHLLVAEDNRANQIVLEKFLIKWGIKTEFVENGRQALERSKTERYDLILMDLQMPEMDGYQATKEIRKLTSTYAQDLPIVALTASALLNVRKKVKELGMTDYITKPFNPEELYKKILKYRGRVIKKSVTAIDHPMGMKLLALADNDVDFMKELAEHYLETYQHFLSSFLKAIENLDEELIQQSFKSIKTSNEVLGISALNQVLKDAPRVIQEKGDQKESLIQEAKYECEGVIAALRYIMSATN